MTWTLDELNVAELRWYYRLLGGVPELWVREELIAAIREKLRG